MVVDMTVLASIDFMTAEDRSWPTNQLFTPEEQKLEVETKTLFERGGVVVNRALQLRQHRAKIAGEKADLAEIKTVRIALWLTPE